MTQLKVGWWCWAVAAALVTLTAGLGAQDDLHQCAIRLQINGRAQGAMYNGAATGTLVEYGGKHYLVTARHNLSRATNTLQLVMWKNGEGYYFNTDAFDGHFVATKSDIVVARFRADQGFAAKGERFAPLLQTAGAMRKVRDPAPGQTLVAVGNPVVALERSSIPRTNIVYHGTIAEYALLSDYTEGAGRGPAKFAIVESLSVARGFSGGPLLLLRNTDPPVAEVAGIVLGGDHRAVVLPGRFVFACPAVAIEKAIQALEAALAQPLQEKDRGKVIPLADEMLLVPTDQSRLLPQDEPFDLSAYDTGKVVVIDVERETNQALVTRDFISRIAPEVENAEMIFYNGTFVGVDLAGLRPSRATFVNCNFTGDISLSRAALMGARFIGCEFKAPGGQRRELVLRPTLGYAITVLPGFRDQAAPDGGIFFTDESPRMALSARVEKMAATIDAPDDKPTPAPLPSAAPATPRFENLLTIDWFDQP